MAAQADVVAPAATRPGRFAGIKSSSEQLRIKLYAALIALDVTMLAFVFVAANFVRFGEPLNEQGLDMLAVVLPIFLGIALNSRAYSLHTLQEPRYGALRVTQSLAFAVAAVIGVIFYLKVSTDFSRAVMAGATIGGLILLPASRMIFGHIVGRKLGWRFTNQVLLVDGVTVQPLSGEIVLFADDAQLAPSLSDPKLLERAGRLLKNCDRVIVACPAERRAAWSAMLKGAGVNVEIRAPELDRLGALGIARYGTDATLVVSQGPLGLSDRIVKRAFDLAVAVPAVIVVAPLLLTIAIAIKLDSPGPVFFRQPRVGLGNRMFRMYKFRSMRVDTLDTNGSQHTLIGDSRVTKVGDFLRRTSLDELPQLLNVLLGDMSIAGPRPHPLGALAGGSLFWEVDDRYWHRHAIKPGMTGLAQVRGFRGTTFRESDLINRLQADLEYLSGWTIWRDVGIVARTALVLTHRNAF